MARNHRFNWIWADMVETKLSLFIFKQIGLDRVGKYNAGLEKDKLKKQVELEKDTSMGSAQKLENGIKLCWRRN